MTGKPWVLKKTNSKLTIVKEGKEILATTVMAKESELNQMVEDLNAMAVVKG